MRVGSAYVLLSGFSASGLWAELCETAACISAVLTSMLESQFGEVLQQRRLGKVEASQASRALLAMSPSSNAVRNAQRLAARTAAQRKALQQLRNTQGPRCRPGVAERAQVTESAMT